MGTVPSESTAAVGGRIKASVWNTDVRDAVNFLLNPPTCRVYQGTTGTTLATATATLIPFDTESWDTDGCHSTSSNTSRLTAVTAGKYLVIAQISYAANATGQRYVTLRKNSAGSSSGGTLVDSLSCDAAASGSTSVFLVTEVWLSTAGDYLEVFGQQSSGGNLATNTGASATFASMTWQSL